MLLRWVRATCELPPFIISWIYSEKLPDLYCIFLTVWHSKHRAGKSSYIVMLMCEEQGSETMISKVVGCVDSFTVFNPHKHHCTEDSHGIFLQCSLDCGKKFFTSTLWDVPQCPSLHTWKTVDDIQNLPELIGNLSLTSKEVGLLPWFLLVYCVC